MEYWKAQSERQLRAVARDDLNGVPVYLVSRVDLDERFDGPGECLAWTQTLLDRRLQPFLEKWGQWSGPGFAAVCCARLLRSHCGNSAWNQAAIMKACLHEFGHWIQTGIRQPETLHPAMAAALCEYDSGQVVQSSCENARPWDAHGSDFIRAILHLSHRASEVGFTVEASELWSHKQYGLAPIAGYVDALGDEPQRLIDASLFDIMASPAPMSFDAFAAGDLARSEGAFRGGISMVKVA